MTNVKGKNIWIIGASAGIGWALVDKLYYHGANLAVSARSEKTLTNLIESYSHKPYVLPLDVTDIDSLHKGFNTLTTKWGLIDSVIYLPAVYNPAELAKLDPETVRSEINVNLMAVFNFIHCIQGYFKQQQNGQILICSSLAGLCGMPNGQPYSATKAAVTNLTQTFKCECPYLDIKVIHPGFVKTRLTDKNNFKMPMLITPEQAAKHIYKGMLKSKFEINFPKRFAILMKFMSLLPSYFYFKIWSRK